MGLKNTFYSTWSDNTGGNSNEKIFSYGSVGSSHDIRNENRGRGSGPGSDGCQYV
jgi:hypothetical protein